MRLHDFLWLRLTKFWILISLTIFWNRIIIQSTTAYSARVFLNAGMLYYGRKGVLNLSIFRFYLSFVFWPHNWPQQEMLYTEITETTCKTVRFSGIYGLYVNNGVQKTYFFDFGYWRPGVRISTRRPKEKESPCGSLLFFYVGVDDENFTLRSRKEFAYSAKMRQACL